MKRVLFVDDEQYVLEIIKRKFEHTDIKCYFTTTVPQAVELLKQEDMDVLVTDIQMADHNGIKFSKLVQEISPRTVRIILSGTSRAASIIEAINEGHVYKYIEKPWTIDGEAIQLIQEAVSRSRIFKEKMNDKLFIPVEELYKFNTYEHWYLVNSAGKIVYINSDYPSSYDWQKEQGIKVNSNLGELNLYSSE